GDSWKNTSQICQFKCAPVWTRPSKAVGQMNPFTWEELRRQARDIENDLDAKLTAFSSINPRSTDLLKSMTGTLQENRSNSPHFVVSGLESGREKVPDFEKPDSVKLTTEIDQLLQRYVVIS
ncbi:unnamed protein product, partial [Dicrocoelium dendriticum]